MEREEEKAEEEAGAQYEWDPVFEYPYYCHECDTGFDDLQEALRHSRHRGVLHKFVVAHRPAIGDHVYTAQYKDLMEEAERPIGEHMERLMVDLISLPEHHGVFAGYRQEGYEDPEVIHFEGCVKGVFSAGDSQISKTSVADFTRGQTLFVQPYDDRLSGEEALHRAFWALSKQGYHCQTFNCEHFAAWCCTGVASSKQAWYSSVFVDPVFPFGWAAVMAKDSTHCAVSWMASGSRSVCFCGKDSTYEGDQGTDGRGCDAGHFICPKCWHEQQARTETDITQCQALRAHSSSFSEAVVGDDAYRAASSSSALADERPEQRSADTSGVAVQEGTETRVDAVLAGANASSNEEAGPPASLIPEPPAANHPRMCVHRTRPLCCLRPSCWADVPEPEQAANAPQEGQVPEGLEVQADSSLMNRLQQCTVAELKIWALGLDGRESSG